MNMDEVQEFLGEDDELHKYIRRAINRKERNDRKLDDAMKDVAIDDFKRGYLIPSGGENDCATLHDIFRTALRDDCDTCERCEDTGEVTYYCPCIYGLVDAFHFAGREAYGMNYAEFTKRLLNHLGVPKGDLIDPFIPHRPNRTIKTRSKAIPGVVLSRYAVRPDGDAYDAYHERIKENAVRTEQREAVRREREGK